MAFLPPKKQCQSIVRVMDKLKSDKNKVSLVCQGDYNDYISD